MIENKVVMFMIAKKQSSRLPGKNNRNFNGDPMFIYNLKKMIKLKVPIYFNSDCIDMINKANALSNYITTSLRPEDISDTDMPSVPIFQFMHSYHNLADISILNVQANSPSVNSLLIESSLAIMKYTNVSELLSIYPHDKSFNGSLWGLSVTRLFNYGDYYLKKPDYYINDESVDIHTEDDLKQALSQELSNE